MAAILVVDDEPVVRELLAHALKAPDRQIFLAEDAETALAQAARIATLDMALVDKNLPGPSGLKLVRLLREKHPQAAYVIMTAYASVDSAVEALRLGLYDYITKPFDLALIESVVSGALSKVRLARESQTSGNGGDERGAGAPDVLTGLPTRATFVRQLDEALARFRADPRQGFAVLVADLDDFGRINDSLGHTAGDELLVGWVRRIAQAVRDDDMVARLGADQFTILLAGVDDEQKAVAMALRLQATTDEPLLLRDTPVALSASIGVNMGAAAYTSGEEVLRDAGVALARAKAQGKGAHAVFVSEMRDETLERIALDDDLRRGISHDEFTTVYQPILSVESSRVVAFEALARWRHPAHGVLMPDRFLSRAGQTGVLVEISWRIIRQACAQLALWLKRGGAQAQLMMSLNVPPSLLLRADFVEDFHTLITRLNLPPARLKVEVTEIVAMASGVKSAEAMQALRRLGVVVCLDDFGTGFASLRWLHDFPVDEIKIDKSFVADMTTNRRSHILVGAAVGLAHSLGLPVVAEGVETVAQLEELRQMRCEYVQGYLFSRPVSSEHAEELLRRDDLAHSGGEVVTS